MKARVQTLHSISPLFLALALGAANHASAYDSTSLTLDGAVDEAMSRSPSIQRAQAIVGENRWRVTEAVGSGFLPKVSASLYHYFDAEYEFTNITFGGTAISFPGIYPTTQLTLDARIPIFDGLANIRHLEAASLTRDASEMELSRVQFQLSQDVRLAFYQALAAAQLDEVAEQNVKTLEDHLRQVNIQRRGGAATNYDTLRVSVQLNEARADAIDAKDNGVLARKKVTQLIGLEQDERPIAGELPEPDAARFKDLELSSGAPADRSDIRALDSRAEAADRVRSAQNSWLIPSVSIGGQLLMYNELLYTTTVIDRGQYEKAYNVGVFVTWNLFDGGVSYDRARVAEFQQTEADRTAQEAKLQVPYEFAYWKRRFLSNADHYQTRKFDVARSEESVRLAKDEEKAGTRTSTETLDAELDLFRAKAGVVNALVNSAEARIRLELALGRRI